MLNGGNTQLFHGTKPACAPDVTAMPTSTVPSLLLPVLAPKSQSLPDRGKERGGQIPAVKRLQRAAGKIHGSEQLAESLVHVPALTAVAYSKARGAPAASLQENLQKAII